MNSSKNAQKVLTTLKTFGNTHEQHQKCPNNIGSPRITLNAHE